MTEQIQLQKEESSILVDALNWYKKEYTDEITIEEQLNINQSIEDLNENNILYTSKLSELYVRDKILSEYKDELELLFDRMEDNVGIEFYKKYLNSLANKLQPQTLF